MGFGLGLGLGLGSGLGLGLGLGLGFGLGSGFGLRLEQFLSVDPGIELGLTVFVTSRRYRQLGLGLGLDQFGEKRVTKRDSNPGTSDSG